MAGHRSRKIVEACLTLGSVVNILLLFYRLLRIRASLLDLWVSNPLALCIGVFNPHETLD